MINSWSLLYDELYGDDEMTEDNTITPQESDEYDPKPQSDSDGADWNDPIITVGSGSTAADDVLNINIDNHWDSITLDTSQLYADYPLEFSTLSDNDDSIAHHVGLNYDELTLNIEDPIRPQDIMTDSRNIHNPFIF